MDERARNWQRRALNALWPGFSDYDTLRETGPMVVAGGEGVYVRDVAGRRYLEANSGLWNAMAGFEAKELVEAACDQLRRFPAYHAFFGRVTEPAVALAEELLRIAPVPMGKVFFANSGSEANDTVVKMLWAIGRGEGRPERRKIITRTGGYHGVTAVSASMTGKDYNRAFGLPLEGFIHAECPHHWRHAREGEDEAAFSRRLAEALDRLIEVEGPETIAGFFAEPVLGAGGVIPPPEGYFEAVQSVLRRHGVPLIADEVITGFGRTGNLWGCQTYGIEPDILVASKCLTGGLFPMAAVLLTPGIAERLAEATASFGEFPHGFTTGAHPVGCAIGLEAIRLVTEGGLLENVRKVAPRFQARLRAMDRLAHVGEARGVGLMGAVEMVADRDTKAPFPEEIAIGERIATTALDHSLICRPLGQAVVLAPPFVITEAEIDELFDALERTIEQTVTRLGATTG